MKTEIYEENGVLIEKTTYDHEPDEVLSIIAALDQQTIDNFHLKFSALYRYVYLIKKLLKERTNDKNCCKTIEKIINDHLWIQMMELETELQVLKENDRDNSLQSSKQKLPFSDI